MTKLQSHLQYFWWAYIIIILAVCVLWTSVFAQLAEPKRNEVLNITYFGEKFDKDAFGQDLETGMSQYTSQIIKEINIKAFLPNNQMIGQLVAIGAESADILIFEEDAFVQKSYQNYFNQLPTELLQAMLPDQELDIFTIDGKAYGIVLDNDARFGEYYSGDKRCIAMLSPYSVNLSALYGVGNAEDSSAIQALKFLLERPNEEN